MRDRPIGVWLSIPLLLRLSPSLFGLIEPAITFSEYAHEVGLLWLAVGVGGVIVRTMHLSFLRGPAWSLAWVAKILTDPFHNIAIYWRSPMALMRGQLLDPILAKDEHAPF